MGEEKGETNGNIVGENLSGGLGENLEGNNFCGKRKYWKKNHLRMDLALQRYLRVVSVLHQDEGGIGKSIPDARKISPDPRDFPRAKPEGNLEGRGKSGGQRGWISQ